MSAFINAFLYTNSIITIIVTEQSIRSMFPLGHKFLPKNQLGIDYVVGDIHGKYSDLINALEYMNFDFDCDRLISVGDIINKGPESERCIEMTKERWFEGVIGNHEHMLISLIECPEVIDSLYRNGGEWIKDVLSDPSQLRQWIEMLKFALSYSITLECEFGDVGIVHAQSPVDDWKSITDGKFDLAKNLDSALWSKDRFFDISGGPVLSVAFTVHGHKSVPEIFLKNNQFWLDTYHASGKVTIKSVSELWNTLCLNKKHSSVAS